MKLPAGHAAIVDIAKLRDYCLSASHVRGRHKARVFASTLGITSADAEILRVHLLHAAREGDVSVGEVDEYGARYTIDSVLARNNRRATVRSAWILLRGEEVPRLKLCIIGIAAACLKLRCFR